MTRVEMLNLINDSYEKGSGGILSLRPFFDEKTGRLNPEGDGDTLAKHIVIEVNEVFPEKASDELQLEQVLKVVQAAKRDLEEVADGLSNKLLEVRGVKRPGEYR